MQFQEIFYLPVTIKNTELSLCKQIRNFSVLPVGYSDKIIIILHQIKENFSVMVLVLLLEVTLTKPPSFKEASWRKTGKVKNVLKKRRKTPLLKGGWALAHVPPYYSSCLVSCFARYGRWLCAANPANPCKLRALRVAPSFFSSCLVSCFARYGRWLCAANPAI